MTETLIVRRCAQCDKAAMVSTRVWRETPVLGLVQTGRVPRGDFVCQSCAAFNTWKTMRRRWLMVVPMGLLALALGVARVTTAPGQGPQARVCSGALVALGLGGPLLVVLRLVARLQHPFLAPPPT